MTEDRSKRSQYKEPPSRSFITWVGWICLSYLAIIFLFSGNFASTLEGAKCRQAREYQKCSVGNTVGTLPIHP